MGEKRLKYSSNYEERRERVTASSRLRAKYWRFIFKKKESTGGSGQYIIIYGGTRKQIQVIQRENPYGFYRRKQTTSTTTLQVIAGAVPKGTMDETTAK
ncbi:hypothetical protein JTB14_007740 [Gonioctena quinquepunctata]|nr:hypothetical protein JTB14_007740 [Gonioctena quinquepunctata]